MLGDSSLNLFVEAKVLFKLCLQQFFLFLKFLETLDLLVAMIVAQIPLDVDST